MENEPRSLIAQSAASTTRLAASAATALASGTTRISRRNGVGSFPPAGVSVSDMHEQVRAEVIRGQREVGGARSVGFTSRPVSPRRAAERLFEREEALP